MNKDEMKMIKEMAEMLIDAQDKCELNPCDECEHRGCREGCWHYLSATELYKKGGRIVADDEIVVKKSEYEELQDCDESNARLFTKNCILECSNKRLKKQLEEVKKETAREISQELKNRQTLMLADEVFGRETVVTRKINELAEKYGIE